jgi:cytochrome c peroxidase
MKAAPAAAVVASMAISVGAWWLSEATLQAEWNAAEKRVLASLWLDQLPPLAVDPTNAVVTDPRAQRLGQQIFFDTRFSANGAVSCATCHQPAKYFTDGLPRGQAIGTSRRNTMTLVGAAYSPWLYWDGRKDSLWAQALSPLEDPQEHGGNRLQYIHILANDRAYRTAYEGLFGLFPELPVQSPEQSLEEFWAQLPPTDVDTVNRVFANLGKAIAAYESLLLPGETRFDQYVGVVLAEQDSDGLLDDFEIAGLRLFISKANCTQCHNGPLFSNNAFHNTGLLSAPGQVPDKGRIEGVRTVRADLFNCLGEYSDALGAYGELEGVDCPELRFANTGEEMLGALRTPSLRNVEQTAPYMHGGQLATLEAVLEHYNTAPLAMLGHNEAKPLALSRRELKQLRAFLATLSAPPAVAARWLRAPPPPAPAPENSIP